MNIGYEMKGGSDFGKSGTVRNAFNLKEKEEPQLKENTDPNEELAEMLQETSGVISRKNFHVTGESSSFLSKVPRMVFKTEVEEDPPTPDPGRLQDEPMPQPAEADNTDTLANQTYTKEGYGFMSATTREGQWLNKDNPFVKTYKVNRTECAKTSQMKFRKNRIDEIRSKIFKNADSVTAPFNTSAHRSKSSDVLVTPGPGSYIDVQNMKNSSVCHKMVSYFEEKFRAYKKGVSFQCFGSNVSRFQDAPHTKTPGPGAYMTPQKQIGHNLALEAQRAIMLKKKLRAQHFMESTSQRFMHQASKDQIQPSTQPEPATLIPNVMLVNGQLTKDQPKQSQVFESNID